MTKATALKFWKLIHAVPTCVVVAACAGGGGGGGGGGPSPVPQPSSLSESYQGPVAPEHYDTGVTRTVGLPARASFGSAPAPTASPDGPVFDNYHETDTFPLMVSSLRRGGGGVTAVTPNLNATATFSTSGQFTNLHLKAPAANIDQDFSVLTTAVTRGLLLSGASGDWLTTGFSYVLMGEWGSASGGVNSSLTRFVFGYEAPAAAMPSTGSATFSGGVSGTVLKPVGGTIHGTGIWGGALFTVDFTSGSITGVLTAMQQANGLGGTLPWNEVSVTASITGSTNRFSGSTAAASSPNTTMGLAGSATGAIDGAFYGPNAENLGAIWSLSDGVGSALGTVTAGR